MKPSKPHLSVLSLCGDSKRELWKGQIRRGKRIARIINLHGGGGDHRQRGVPEAKGDLQGLVMEMFFSEAPPPRLFVSPLSLSSHYAHL